MRKHAFLFLLTFIVAITQAQDYLISFEGTGAATMVDSVWVENLTRGTRLTVGSGNQLQLLGSLSSIDHVRTTMDSTMKICPNPAMGDAVVTFNATSNDKATIELTDMLGHQVAKTQNLFSMGRESFRISGLNSGTFMVQVRSEGYHYSGKIISQSTSGSTTQIICHRPSSGRPDPGPLKQSRAVVIMQYTTGDLLKFTGKSDVYSTVVMDIPTCNETITFSFAPCTDYDNSHYTIVRIGSQTWMAENLKSLHYSDGTSINYYDYGNDPNNSLIYGRLYAWSSAMKGAASSNTNPGEVQGVCPTGWHLPGKSEWQQLGTTLGGLTIAGGKLKETGTSHWIAPNTGATDEHGFTALPAGMHDFTNIFQWIGDHCAFSTATGNPAMVEVTAIMLQTSSGILTIGTFHPDDALSVRCLKN